MYSRFSSNSEANDSELLRNLEELFPRYYIHSGFLDIVKSSITHMLPVAKRLNSPYGSG